MGADDPEHPQYQVGEGCLVDQLVGQYLAEVAGLGALVSREHVRAALGAVYRYNYKRSLAGTTDDPYLKMFDEGVPRLAEAAHLVSQTPAPGSS